MKNTIHIFCFYTSNSYQSKCNGTKEHKKYGKISIKNQTAPPFPLYLSLYPHQAEPVSVRTCSAKLFPSLLSCNCYYESV